MILFLYNTGCRPGEAARVKIKDIDFINKFVLIKKTKLGKGRWTEDYIDRCGVQQIALDLYAENHEMRAPAMAEHTIMKKWIGRRAKYDTIIRWIQELGLHGQGRPKKSKNIIPK